MMNKKLSPYICHGIDFANKQGDEHIARCLFCDKTSHFYVNEKTGQFNCKKCGENGNVFTFLKKYSKLVYEETLITDYKRLRADRGLSIQTLRDWKLGWNGTCWLLPVMSETKSCLDIRRWNPKTKIMKSTTGCHVQLYGWYKASKAKNIWLCEGEWDTIALSHLLGKTNTKDRAVGSPGAMTFKDEWVAQFKDKTVFLCYDNDPAGEQGTMKVYHALKSVVRTIKIIRWPIVMKRGYDVRDCVIKYGNKALLKLKKYMVSPEDYPLIGKQKPKKQKSIGKGCSFEKTLQIYKKYADMDQELIDCLKIIFATVLSIHEPKDPLWLYVVGPAGSGKTMLLQSLDNNDDQVICRSTISANGLLSGFKAKEDPSLLPKLRGKCLVWKDFTELLSKKSYDKPDIYNTLRGAYDGVVNKSYGNGLTRHYKDLYFSMLAGVTPAIHGDAQAMMGERFLKYEMYPDVTRMADKQIMAALNQTEASEDRTAKMQKAALNFLNRKCYPVHVPVWVKHRLVALSQLIGKLRTKAERETYGDRAVIYKPIPEVGTRLAQQLQKLGKYLAIVDDQPAVGLQQYQLMERVAFDTSDKVHLEIVDIIGENAVETQTIVRKVGLAYSNVYRRLEDLTLIDVVVREGKKPVKWTLTEAILKLRSRAKLKMFNNESY